MSLLDDASLLVTPNAEKEGKLYSIIPTNGNGDFSVTRATTATRVNAAGLVELVPYNLLQYSEQFDNAAWSKTGATITANSITSPSGVQNADTITQSGATINIFQSINISNTGNYTYSVYLKKGNFDSSSPFRFGVFRGTDLGYITFNFATNTTSVISGTFVSHSATSVGNGWYLIQYTINIPTTGNANFYNGGVGGNIGTGNFFYSWGAQLVEGTSALAYQMTETRLNIPRLDYSLGSCPNILLEPQRTNLALRSEEFDNAVWTGNAIKTANQATSPSGLLNADRLQGTGTLLTQEALQSNISVVLGTTYTHSVYAKKNTNNFIQMGGGTNSFGALYFANFDLNNGVVGTVGSAVTSARIQDVGNGWYRCSITGPAILTTNSNPYIIWLITSATSIRGEANTLSTSVFLWGAQLEAGAYATSYIPTTSASVTRNADIISRGNIFTNGLITASGGTWFVDLSNNRALARDASANGLYLTDATAISFGFRIKSSASPLRYFIAKVIGGVETSLYLTSANTSKVAIKWNGTTADVFENGVKVVTATAFTNTAMQVLASNVSTPVNINSMALFPTPLTDTQCIALTT